ncbi:MAG: ABC transporter permease [Planctomycetota bacterium]|jgi:putative ABC transport system permease protein|nr:ABC transporter permease [Planctomycetota bacterium]
MKPLTTVHIALNNLKRRPLRSAGLALAVAVFSFTMFGGALLSASVKNGIDSLSRRLGADILVVPRGYDKKLQAALLRGEPSAFYIKGDLADKLRDVPGVEKTAPQLYLATLDAACCTVPIQVIAYDPASDFVIAPWMASAASPTPGDDEVVVGSMIVGEAGGELSLFGRTFRIAARLDRTGMGFDTTVFTTMGNARKLLRTAKNAAIENFQPDSVSAVMVGVQPGRDLKQVANAILREFALEYDLDIVVAKNMISDIAKKLGGLSYLVHILAAAFWAAAAGVLSLFFSLLLHERRREFGLFRILGATRGKLAGIVLCEALAVGAAGGLLGIMAALGLTLPFHRHVAMSLELPYLAVSFPAMAILGAACLAVSLAVGPLASLYSVCKIGLGDAYLTLRSGE